MVGIEPDARHIVTVSLSEPDQFVGALVNLAGKVVAAPHLRAQRPHRRRRRSRCSATICDDLSAMPSGRCSASASPRPGIVDHDGTVLRAARLGWSQARRSPTQLAARTGLGGLRRQRRQRRGAGRARRSASPARPTS